MAREIRWSTSAGSYRPAARYTAQSTVNTTIFYYVYFDLILYTAQIAICYLLPAARLPPLNMLYDQVFKREGDGRLIQDPKRRNVLFHTFYQFFMLQFFDKDFSATVTGSQLYGSDRATQKELRSMSGGKLKTTYLDGEHYPPRFSFAEKIKKVFTRTPMMAGKSHWVSVNLYCMYSDDLLLFPVPNYFY